MSDLELIYGEDKTLDVQVTDETGVPGTVDISSSEFWFVVKADWLDSDSAALLTKTVGSGIAIADGPNGQATIAIADTDFAAFDNEPRQYVWGLAERNGGTVYRLDRGTMLISPAVLEVLT